MRRILQSQNIYLRPDLPEGKAYPVAPELDVQATHSNVTTTGTAHGDTIIIYANNVQVASVPVVRGKYTATFTLADGRYAITARAQIGETLSPYAAIVSLLIDTLPPAVPTIERPRDSDVYYFYEPTLSTMFKGTAEPGATVEITFNEVVVGYAVAGMDGAWILPSCTISAATT